MPARPFCNLTSGRMPAGITSASARGGYAQGGIGSERAGRPLRLSCQLVVGAQGVAYAAMKVALNSGPPRDSAETAAFAGAMGNGRFNVAVSFDEPAVTSARIPSCDRP